MDEITIHTDNVTIKARKIYTFTLFHRPEKEVVGTKGFWIWKEDVIEKVSHYDIKMEYKGLDDTKRTYNASSKDSNLMHTIFKDMQKQIKEQDSSYIDRAFEDTVLK